ncbi:Calcium-activated potassium channel subunit alpha-1 [Homalodisca vitripennis]|nr:Calcium-activated potassium channel subunit alpha-1 [Homalodisca vitripennis]
MFVSVTGHYGSRAETEMCSDSARIDCASSAAEDRLAVPSDGVWNVCEQLVVHEVISTTPAPNAECLKERKWWCFLLSSIFTFLAGLLIVLLWRVFAFLCCRKEPEFSPNDPKQKEQKAARQGKQEFEGTFMTEAKDWAGELISGQTTTGRILRGAASEQGVGQLLPGWQVSRPLVESRGDHF